MARQQRLTTSDESGMSWMTAKAELEIRVLGVRFQDGVSESAFSKCAQKASLRQADALQQVDEARVGASRI